jgi:hypothetical protein
MVVLARAAFHGQLVLRPANYERRSSHEPLLAYGLGHDPPPAHDPAARRLLAQGLARGLGVEHHKVGAGAGHQPVVGQPQQPRGVLGDHPQRGGDLVGRAELGGVGDDQRDLERVGGAERIERVVDAVLPGG